MRILSRFILPLALLTCAASTRADAPKSKLHQIARYEIGGEGGWDYVTCDSPGHRLFVTRGSHVQVVSTDTGKLIADLTDARGCHGVALAPDLKRGFISNGGDNTVTVFDTTTLKTVQSVAVGGAPDAILYDPFTRQVFTFNARSQDTTAFDAATGKNVRTLALGGKPEFAQSDGKGHIFVNVEDTSELVTFDAKALTVVRRTKIAPAEEPTGLALDTKAHRLYASCGNKYAAVVDSETGKLIATPAIGDGPDAASLDPRTGDVFMSNGTGTLSIIHRAKGDKFTVDSVPTEAGARTMTYDPATRRAYLVTAKYLPSASDTSAGARVRRQMQPGSFAVLVYGEWLARQ